MRALTRTTRGRRAARGLTLIELVVVASLLTVLMTAFARASTSTTELFQTSTSRVVVEQALRKSLASLREELELAAAGSFDVSPLAPAFATGLTFARVEAVDPTLGNSQWQTFELELRLEPGETDDGTDEDGDGLIDERELIFTRDPGGTAELEFAVAGAIPELFPGETFDGTDENGNGLIDEAGFAVHREGDVLFVMLARESVDSSGREIARTLQTAIRLRGDS